MTTLLLVDVQKSFHPGGSLAIPTANDDADRIVSLLRKSNDSIDRIVATLDSHHKLHIAHPSFWLDQSGEHPNPFTIITSQDILSEKWKPRSDLKLPTNGSLVDAEIFGGETSVVPRADADGNVDLTKYCIEYTRRLEEKGRFQLCIWPEHCLIGTLGHCVVDEVRNAMEEWSDATGGSIEWILKGQNLLTEMYSALCAEVPISSETSFNAALHDSLLKSDRLLIAGQAMSHCVNYTTRDIVENWPVEDRNKIVILTDCASSVPGFEEASEIFLKDMKKAGVSLSTSTEVMKDPS